MSFNCNHNTDCEQIVARIHQLSDLLSAREPNVDAIMELFTPDIVFMPTMGEQVTAPGEGLQPAYYGHPDPPVTYLRNLFEGLTADWDIHITPDVQEVAFISSTEAYARDIFTETTTNRHDGRVLEIDGSEMMLLRKEGQEWYFSRFIFSICSSYTR